MWDGYIERIAVANHCINLIDEETRPILADLYRAKVERRDLEQVDLDGMLREQNC